MINLILLPFRGIFWLISGCLCTLPWLLIVAPLTTNYWLPTALSIYCEKQLGFPCRIGSTNVNLMKGQINLNDIVISNPSEFASGDFLKIKQIQCKVDPLSCFQGIVKLSELNMEISQFASIQQNKMNNLQKLCEHFNRSNATTKSKKGWHIASVKLTFKGVASLRNYTHSIFTSEAFITKNFNFTNICINTPNMFNESLMNTTSLESVYTNISDSLMNTLTSSLKK